MPVLDTSFLIDLQRGHKDARSAQESLIAANARLLLPTQTAMEFLYGIEDQARALHRLEEASELVPFDRPQVLEAAYLAREAKKRGVGPLWSDVQIAAIASLEADYVVTANPRHFEPFGVEVWDYRRAAAPPQGAP